MLFFSSILNDLNLSFCQDLENALVKFNIPFSYLNNTKDIWLRDFMPIQIGTNKFVQFSLTKNYYYKKDKHKQTDPAPICKSLGIEPIIASYKNKPIYLDGGNVILNPSRTKAIITEKVFDDNKIPPDLLKGLLQEVLQVEQVIFIPVEPDDDTGHSDGMVRFVGDRLVIANDYSKIDMPRNFKDRFYGALSGSGLDVLLVPYNPVNMMVDGLWAAIGCYINFLKVKEKILLPTFDDPANDEAAIERFGKIFGLENVIPVPSREIALGGGVLNCLSWEISSR